MHTEVSDVIISMKDALKREKSKFRRGIWNADTLKDLDIAFHELNKLVDSVVKGNFGGLREPRNYYRIGELCPMLQQSMFLANNAIIPALCLENNKEDNAYHGSSQVFLIFSSRRKSVENIPVISAIGLIP